VYVCVCVCVCVWEGEEQCLGLNAEMYWCFTYYDIGLKTRFY